MVGGALESGLEMEGQDWDVRKPVNPPVQSPAASALSWDILGL